MWIMPEQQTIKLPELIRYRQLIWKLWIIKQYTHYFGILCKWALGRVYIKSIWRLYEMIFVDYDGHDIRG